MLKVQWQHEWAGHNIKTFSKGQGGEGAGGHSIDPCYCFPVLSFSCKHLISITHFLGKNMFSTF